jgi:hypothetical protein
LPNPATSPRISINNLLADINAISIPEKNADVKILNMIMRVVSIDYC